MINPDKVRTYLRDIDELNILLDNEEQFGDEEIAMFYKDSVDEVVSTRPAAISRIDDIPDVIFVYFVISKLLASEANLQNRNQATIADDNVGNIDLSGKMQQYMSLSQSYEQKAYTLLDGFLSGSFYREMWGGVSSTSSDYEFGLFAGEE